MIGAAREPVSSDLADGRDGDGLRAGPDGAGADGRLDDRRLRELARRRPASGGDGADSGLRCCSSGSGRRWRTRWPAGAAIRRRRRATERWPAREPRRAIRPMILRRLASLVLLALLGLNFLLPSQPLTARGPENRVRSDGRERPDDRRPAPALRAAGSRRADSHPRGPPRPPTSCSPSSAASTGAPLRSRGCSGCATPSLRPRTSKSCGSCPTPRSTSGPGSSSRSSGLADRILFLADPKSSLIRQLGILKEDPESIEVGVPHPTTLAPRPHGQDPFPRRPGELPFLARSQGARAGAGEPSVAGPPAYRVGPRRTEKNRVGPTGACRRLARPDAETRRPGRRGGPRDRRFPAQPFDSLDFTRCGRPAEPPSSASARGRHPICAAIP